MAIGQSFVERCEDITKLSELKRAVREAVAPLGFRYFACLSHVDPLNPPEAAIVIHNYPQKWMRYFSENGLARTDPVFQHAGRTAQPFFWEDEEFRATLSRRQRQILATAEGFGLSRGFTVPIHSPGALPASCSVIPEGDATPQENPLGYLAIYLMAIHMHETAARIVRGHAPEPVPFPRLTAQEQRCLRYAALGKSDWAIAQIMGLSQSTVHHHIENAKKRLGTSTRVQAVVQALYGQQLSFDEVIESLAGKR